MLDSYSAFPGESNLGFLKNLVRGGFLPLQQVIKRIAERESCEKICEFEEKQVHQKEGLHKGILYLKDLRLDPSEKNRWILTKNYEIFKIECIFEEENVIKIHGAVLPKENQENLYELPMESTKLCIYVSKLESTSCSITLKDMFVKLYRIELSDKKSAFMPLFHYTQ